MQSSCCRGRGLGGAVRGLAAPRVPCLVQYVSRQPCSCHALGRRGPLCEDQLEGVQIVKVPGKGRGIVTLVDVAPGALLLQCVPLALITRPAPASILESDLVDRIEALMPGMDEDQQVALSGRSRTCTRLLVHTYLLAHTGTPHL
jgi:hypothetical protein